MDHRTPVRTEDTFAEKEDGPMGTTYHEDLNQLSDAAKEAHRALTTVIEELEAVDWYNQRVDVCKDAALKAIMAHNRDEEIEHASMGLEWLRRTMPKFDVNLGKYLFTSGDVTHLEAAGGGPAEAAGDGGDSLGLGNLKGA
jgi:ferritin-like protein